jgi:diguanylate cyclase
MEAFLKSAQQRAAAVLLAVACFASISFGWLLNQSMSRANAPTVWRWPSFSWRDGYSTAGSLHEYLPAAGNILLMLLATIGAAACAIGVIVLFQRAADARKKEEAKEIGSARQKLSDELLAAMNLLRSQIEKNKNFSAALNSGDANLHASQQDPEKVRTVIRLLLAANTQIQQANAEYEKKLLESHEQVGALRAALEQTQELAARDSLTNAFTRRHFDEMLAKHVKGAKNARPPLSLVMADLDHFKNINDRFGHPVGDEVLKNFSALLFANTKGRDCVARYGGEEFAIILPNTSLNDAAKLAAQIRTQLAMKRWMTKTGVSLGLVTASFGVAELEQFESPASLIERADAKLYQSKAAGRNRVFK